MTWNRIRWELVLAIIVPIAWALSIYISTPPPGSAPSISDLPGFATLPAAFDSLPTRGDAEYYMKGFGTYFIVIAPVDLDELAVWLTSVDTAEELRGAWKPKDTPIPALTDVGELELHKMPVLFQTRDERGFGRLYLCGETWIAIEGTRRSD